MSVTARQHTVIALLLCCALASALHLGHGEISYAELAGMETQYGMYPPLPRILYSAIVSGNTISVLHSRFISIVFSGFGLLFSWLLARRIVSASLALAAPAVVAGASFWNMSARSATPNMLMLAAVLAGIWLAFPPSSPQSAKPLLRHGISIIKLLSAVIVIAASLPFYGGTVLENTFWSASAADVFSVFPFIACIPFAIWFAAATRKNTKSAAKSRNAAIMLAVAAALALQSLAMHGNIGILCLPFAVISGMRIVELVFAPEISPRAGWIAVLLPYSIVVAIIAVPLFSADESIGTMTIFVLALWGISVLVGAILPRTIIRQWLACAVIAVGVVVPLLLMLRIAAGNLRNSPNSPTLEHKSGTISIY